MSSHSAAVFLVLSALLLLPQFALADLTCTRFVPRGRKGNAGAINYAGQRGEDFIPPTNATVGNPVFLNTTSNDGIIFHFESCNSTSLGFSSYNTDSDCDDTGCQRTYFNFIRAINPATSHCLTDRALVSQGVTELYPKTCNDNPSTGAQIFPTLQTAYYTMNFISVKSFGSTYFYPYGANAAFNPTQQASPWVIASDKRTVLYDSAQP